MDSQLLALPHQLELSKDLSENSFPILSLECLECVQGLPAHLHLALMHEEGVHSFPAEGLIAVFPCHSSKFEVLTYSHNP
jgi:hypothetical protein